MPESIEYFFLQLAVEIFVPAIIREDKIVLINFKTGEQQCRRRTKLYFW